MSLSLGHVSIHVSDLTKAEEFYQDLGMKVVSRFDEYVFLEAKFGILGLRQLPEGFHKADQILEHFGFFVDSIDELRALSDRLKAKGVKTTPIKQHRDGYTSFYFLDPDGNKVQVLCAPTPQGCS